MIPIRKGFKTIGKLPKDEEFVVMVMFRDIPIICSTKKVYRMEDGKLVQLKIEVKTK